MGDVVHTLPALTDAAKADPAVRFDWVVDEAFADIPAWHKNIEKVFPVGLRRLRRELNSVAGRAEVKTFLRNLRSQTYDVVIDLQGEFKSAFVARLAKGRRFGYDGASAREWGAHMVYQNKFAVPKGIHSMARMRKLLAQALSYTYDECSIDYGIQTQRLPAPLPLKKPYVVFVHNTSWESKNWPESYWRELAERVSDSGFSIVLPWGSESERERAARIAGDDPNRFVLPKLSIAEKAAIIGGARATVGLDTGLSHIAAALGVAIGDLYGATDPNLCGTVGAHQIHVQSTFQCVKCHETTCSFVNSTFRPACFEKVEPNRVWTELQPLIVATSAKPREVYQLA